jgi:hypothetical protein
MRETKEGSRLGEIRVHVMNEEESGAHHDAKL